MPAVYIAPHPLAPTREDKAVRERAAKQGFEFRDSVRSWSWGMFHFRYGQCPLVSQALRGQELYFSQNGRPDGWRAETGPGEKAAQSGAPFLNLEQE